MLGVAPGVGWGTSDYRFVPAPQAHYLFALALPGASDSSFAAASFETSYCLSSLSVLEIGYCSFVLILLATSHCATARAAFGTIVYLWASYFLFATPATSVYDASTSNVANQG